MKQVENSWINGQKLVETGWGAIEKDSPRVSNRTRPADQGRGLSLSPLKTTSAPLPSTGLKCRHTDTHTTHKKKRNKQNAFNMCHHDIYLGTDLVTALSGLKVNDFTHGDEKKVLVLNFSRGKKRQK